MLSTTEETILQAFSHAAGQDGAIERVKKMKDYAFVHFRDRDLAIKAMNMMNGTSLLMEEFCCLCSVLVLKETFFRQLTHYFTARWPYQLSAVHSIS